MRNPLKKITKKINFRLANNAAQHSSSHHKSSSTDGAERRSGAGTGNSNSKKKHKYMNTSVTEIQHDDPLFNNRSSKLRLALAESKKASYNNGSPSRASATATPVIASETAPTKKKKKSRLPFGPSYKSSSSRATFDRDDHDHQQQHQQIHLQQAQHQQPLESIPPTPERAPSTDTDETPTRKTSASSAMDHHNLPPQPDTQPQQQLQTQPQKPRSSKSSKKPYMDPHLERIAKAAAALDNTGNELFERGEYDKAMANYVKALKLKNRTLAGSQQPQTDELGNPIQPPAAPAPAVAAAAAGDPPGHGTSTSANAQQPQTDAAKATTQPQQPPPAANAGSNGGNGADDLWISVATSINNIGYLRQQSGQASAEETMQAYQNSLQIKRRVLGKDNLSVGKTLNNLGTVHYLKREYDQALAAYREALQIMMASLGPNHLDVGTVHSNMGDVFWAQSGDSNNRKKKKGKQGDDNNNNSNDDNNLQSNYQSSRDAALMHYRQSLEIRWEELKDHKDPKVIRLLEKIAALEMGESFLALVQNNHRHRMSPKANQVIAEEEEEGDTTDSTDPDEAIEAETSKPPVTQELHTLHQEVQEDVKTMDMMERKMAIDMVKDKLRLIREMKKLSVLDDDVMSLGVKTPTIKVQPLSPVERNEALSAVKGRLQQLRESRTREPDILRRHTVCIPSDLKEADQSPANYVMSQRASQLLQRTFLIKPSPTASEYEELNKFSFFNVQHHEIDVASDDASDISDITRSTLSVSRRGRQSLDEGLHALRSQPIPTAGENSNSPWPTPGEKSNITPWPTPGEKSNITPWPTPGEKSNNPWAIASTALEKPPAVGSPPSPETPATPATPLPSASMAAF